MTITTSKSPTSGSPRPLRTSLALFAAVGTVLLAGCGGSTGGGESSSAAAPAPSGSPQMSDQQTPSPRVVVDVTIAGGKVTPTNEQIDAKVNEPIVIRVNSDAADELHVHSVPDHEFEIAAKPNQQFQFTVTVPGSVDVELHHLDRTVATLRVS